MPNLFYQSMSYHPNFQSISYRSNYYDFTKCFKFMAKFPFSFSFFLSKPSSDLPKVTWERNKLIN